VHPMGSRVVLMTATPGPRRFHTNTGTGRSTVGSQAIAVSAGMQIGQASKTIKIDIAKVAPQRACHETSHTICGLKQPTGLPVAIANRWLRYATYLQREIRTIPERSKDDGTRLGDRGLAQARAGVTAQAARAVKRRRSGPVRGGGWSVATVAVRRPTGMCGQRPAL